MKQAADGLESLSRNLADKDPGDLLNAVRDFGRRNPAAFIGGAVLVGVALGRFVRASEPDHALRRIGEEDLAFVEEQAFEGPEELGASGGLAAPIADDLGDLSASDSLSTTSPVGVDDEAPDLTGADPATSPHVGGR